MLTILALSRSLTATRTLWTAYGHSAADESEGPRPDMEFAFSLEGGNALTSPVLVDLIDPSGPPFRSAFVLALGGAQRRGLALEARLVLG